MIASNSFCSPRRTSPLLTPRTWIVASSAADAAVAMNRRTFTRATGTPTLRAATALPPEPKIQLPNGVRSRM
jgi:hypothetical protein